MGSKRPTLTESEACAVIEHTEYLIEAAERAINSYTSIHPRNRTLWIEMQIKYWRNVRSGLKWSISQALQSTKRKESKKDAASLDDSGNANQQGGTSGGGGNSPGAIDGANS